MSISLNQNDLSDQMTRDNDSSDIILLTDKLTVVYSTGATQVSHNYYTVEPLILFGHLLVND